MDNQPIQNTKKHSKATVIVTWANVIVALIMTFHWFMPLVSVNGSPVGLLGLIRDYGLHDTILDPDFLSFLGIFLLPYAVTIIWAAIPKVWASVVGTIYSLPVILFSFMLADAASELADVIFIMNSFVFRNYFSILLLVLSIVKLVLTIKDKKRA